MHSKLLAASFLTLVALAACGSDETAVTPGADAGAGDDSSASYRAILLPYTTAGVTPVAASVTNEGWMLAMQTTGSDRRQDTQIWSVRDGRVNADERITLTEEMLNCPAGSGAYFARVLAFAVALDGHGLLVAGVRCNDVLGEVAFERANGAWKLLPPEALAALPERHIVRGVACMATSCALVYDTNVNWGAVEGNSSISLSLFRNGRFEAPVLDEQENDDDRLLSPTDVTAAQDAYVVTGFEGSTSSPQKARAFRVDDAGAKPVDLAGYEFVTPGVAASDGRVLWAASKVGTSGATLLSLSKQGDVSVVGTRTSADEDHAMRAVAALGTRYLESREVRHDDDPGYDAELRLDDVVLSLPPLSRDVSLRGIVVRNDEALVFGDQIADHPNHANEMAPFLVLVSSQSTLENATALADLPGDGCTAATVATDCASADWGVKCVGYFSCVNATCTQNCDFTTCGDGRCDVAGGETKASCPDCK